jgi:hypothetical protein
MKKVVRALMRRLAAGCCAHPFIDARWGMRFERMKQIFAAVRVARVYRVGVSLRRTYRYRETRKLAYGLFYEAHVFEEALVGSR